MPNTFTMQEFIRTEIDYYFDNEELGKPVETPFVYSIQKGAWYRSLHLIRISHYLGTPIPSNIILLRDGSSSFFLQPSQPMSIESVSNL
jgi:hypothetical protein